MNCNTTCAVRGMQQALFFFLSQGVGEEAKKLTTAGVHGVWTQSCGGGVGGVVHLFLDKLH